MENYQRRFYKILKEVTHYMIFSSKINIIKYLGGLMFLSLISINLALSNERELKKKFCIYNTYILGYSIENRPIYLIEMGNGKEITLILGVIHGDEPQGKYIIEKLRDYLKLKPDILKGKKVLLIPVANPDGLIRKTRTNARGVDLNRNFPTKDWGTIKQKRYNPGKKDPEPETKIIIKVIERYKPHKVISIHSYYRYCNNYDGPAEELAKVMSKYNKYPVKSYIGYPTPGSLGTYLGKERNIPIVTLELPNNISNEKAWLQNKTALIAAIKFNIIKKEK